MDLTEDTDFKFLLFKIKQKLAVDFTEYRLPCLRRRIDSRVRLNKLENYREYANFLDHDIAELEQLLKTLTIHLTEFYRDKSAWEVIEKKIIPIIIEQKLAHKNKQINVWSAGSSSGEEAYTLAILFHSVLGSKLSDFSLKIYGTDIDKFSLQKAEKGCYSAKNLEHIPLKILKNYFYYDGKEYHVNKDIQKLTLFKYSDLIHSDLEKPMDLIVCRNVMIYFNRQLQMKILDKFCKLLKTNGFLMLGKTESILYQSQPKLNVFNSKERIYSKID